MNELTELQKQEIKEVIAFAQKTVKLRTGLTIKLFYETPKDLFDSFFIPPVDLVRVMLRSLKIEMEDVQSDSRKREVVAARQIITHILKKYYKKITLKQIGHLFGGQDHTTIVNSNQKAQLRMDSTELFFIERYYQALGAVEKWVEHNKKKFEQQSLTA